MVLNGPMHSGLIWFRASCNAGAEQACLAAVAEQDREAMSQHGDLP